VTEQVFKRQPTSILVYLRGYFQANEHTLNRRNRQSDTPGVHNDTALGILTIIKSSAAAAVAASHDSSLLNPLDSNFKTVS